MTPIETVRFDSLFGNLNVFIAVDTNNRKVGLGKLGDERPLVWMLSRTRPSPIAPKTQQHDFSAVVRQLEFDAVDIDRHDVGCFHSDLQCIHFKNALL